MGFLAGKRILITGLLSNRSIAYGIASACKREGAELAFTYVGERFRTASPISPRNSAANWCLNATSAATSRSRPPSPRSASTGRPSTGWSTRSASRRARRSPATSGRPVARGFRVAHDISAYSFPALAKAALPLLSDKASLLTLSYLGAERVVPNYNTMGLAKASLEASVRYLAASVGPRGIRANGISAGPIKTLAASGIKGFGKLLSHFEDAAPLRRNVTIEEVGNVAAFLLSDTASGVTGEITYVDGGFNVMGASLPAEE